MIFDFDQFYLSFDGPLINAQYDCSLLWRLQTIYLSGPNVTYILVWFECCFLAQDYFSQSDPLLLSLSFRLTRPTIFSIWSKGSHSYWTGIVILIHLNIYPQQWLYCLCWYIPDCFKYEVCDTWYMLYTIIHMHKHTHQLLPVEDVR